MSPLHLWRQNQDKLAAPLRDLTAEIEDVARTRNLIAYGLFSACSQPEASLTCRDPVGAEVTISLAELAEVAERLDAVRLRLHHLT
ncbi:hypothetical protein [Brevundimonas sp. M20]|uniref:hypothetical protein n=1 Tax=Brevundimonas sp. M20 TaxID=2591463 RepID=UPI00143D1ABD|nr:hypothetical protein [Brevundimonas sp. M20]